MKQKKLNLKEISNALSRNEMKKIMAGSGNCAGVGANCGGYTGVVCCPDLHLECLQGPGTGGTCIYSYP